MIDQAYAYGIVLGGSLFGILWGLANIYLVSSNLQIVSEILTLFLGQQSRYG
jgi:hypothetical protein